MEYFFAKASMQKVKEFIFLNAEFKEIETLLETN